MPTNLVRIRRSERDLGRYALVNTAKDVLKRIRAGKVHTLAVVVIQSDGTFWTGCVGREPDSADNVNVIGSLRFLEHDIICKAGRDE